jgi:hypothetical protein
MYCNRLELHVLLLLAVKYRVEVMAPEQFFTTIYDRITPDKDGCRFFVRNPNSMTAETVRVSGKQQNASRIVLERRLGRPIKPRYIACHTCDHPKCISEEHIYEGTWWDNYRDYCERHSYPRKLRARQIDRAEEAIRRLSPEQRQILYERLYRSEDYRAWKAAVEKQAETP